MSGRFDDMVGARWELGARGPGAFDCLGVVLEACERLELPMFDPWKIVADAWANGWRDYGEALPGGWLEVQPPYPVGTIAQLVLDIDDQLEHHLAVHVEPGRWLHTTRATGVLLAAGERLIRPDVVRNAWLHRGAA